MKIWRRMKGVFLVDRLEVVNKWWHRLFSVVLFGSAIIVFIITISLILASDSHAWVTYKPVAFSLEPNYQTASGKELACTENVFAFLVSGNDTVINSAGITCEGIVLSESDSKHYEALYRTAEKNLQTKFGVEKYFNNSYYNCPVPSTPKPVDYKLTSSDISCIRDEMFRITADEAKMLTR